MRTALFALLLALALGGCASTARLGQDFPLDRFLARVQPGVTTGRELEAWLGPPAAKGGSVEPDGTRYRQWTWYFGSGTLPALRDARFKILQVKLDQEGRVRAYTWSSP
ncbi:MAG: hypothetical protein D6809_04525 [Gammaproteobacteria bacterium]|nr:MAG: hypothetical protein D6809_04525 [Gammaproteobacteria bacterium]